MLVLEAVDRIGRCPEVKVKRWSASIARTPAVKPTCRRAGAVWVEVRNWIKVRRGGRSNLESTPPPTQEITASVQSQEAHVHRHS